MASGQPDDPIATSYRALSGALYVRDGPAAMAALLSLDALREPDLEQHAGEAVLLGLAQGMPAAVAAARRVATALRARDAEGDEDLAHEIDAALGAAAPPERRTLPIDLDELSLALEGDPGLTGGRIDLRTGDVHHVSPVFGDAGEFDGNDQEVDALGGDAPAEPEERWLWFDSLGSRAGFDDMEDFLATIRDQALADRLERALAGRRPFRRFKDELADDPAQLARFYRFSDDRRLGRARAWLAANGLRRAVPDTRP